MSTRNEIVGKDPRSVALVLGYPPEDVRGVSIEPDRVYITVEDSNGEALTIEHMFEEI